MTDSCLNCKEPVIFGKVIEKDGKKVREKFELDGKTMHVCKQKDSGRKFQPQKPREEFVFVEARRGKLPNDQDYIRTYEMHRFGFVGELDPQKQFAEMQVQVFKFLASEAGNAKQTKEEPKK